MKKAENIELEISEDGGDFLERLFMKYEIRTESIKGSKGTRYHILIDDDIQKVIQYRRHFAVLREATKHDEVVLYISSYGGYLDTAVQYIYALLDTKAKTKSIIYCAASAATLIGFVTDEVEVKPYGTIMLHNFSVAQQGKGQELRAKTEFDDRQFKALCELVYSDLLSKKELKDLQMDKDFWMLGTEFDARREKHNWKPLRERGI